MPEPDQDEPGVTPPGEPELADPAELLTESAGLEPIAVVPWPILWRQRMTAKVEHHGAYPWIVVAAALFGLFAVGFSITILAVALEDIAVELDTTTNTIIWVVTGPILLGAVITPSAGKLADVFGARRVYLISMALLAVFAALAAMAWSASSLITFRVIGAAIGTATGPASIAIINRLFPRERRAQALGYWSLVAAGGPVLGVIAGGPIVESVGWRPIFWAQVPLALATVVVCAIVFPDTERLRGVRFDTAGALLLAGGSGAFVVALNRAPEVGWANPLVLVGFALTPALLIAFVLHERGITDQLIPLRYFRERNVTFPFVNQFFVNFAYMGGFFLTPFMLRQVLDYGPSKVGYLSVARPLAFAIMGPIAGYVATKVGERINGIVGALCIAVALALLATVEPTTEEWFIVAVLIVWGIGMGITAPSMTAAIANAVAERDLGVVGGAQLMVSQIGVAVGTQLMLTVQQAVATTGTAAESYHAGYLVGVGAALVACVAAIFVRDSHHPTAEDPLPDVVVTA